MKTDEWTCSINGWPCRITEKRKDGEVWWKVKPSGTNSAFGAHYTTRSDGTEELHFDYYDNRQPSGFVTLSEGSTKSEVKEAGEHTFNSRPFADTAVVPSAPSTKFVTIGQPDNGGNSIVKTDGPCFVFGFNSGSDFQNPMPKRQRSLVNS